MTAEGEEFNSKLKTTLPLLCKYLKRTVIIDGPGRFVRIHEPVENVQDLDHLLFQCLQTCVNIVNTCPNALTSSSLNEHINNIAGEYSFKLIFKIDFNCINVFVLVSCQELLRDDHVWVRLGALRFLKKYLSTVDTKAVALLASKKIDKDEKRFLYSNARQSVKMLCLDLMDQVIPGQDVLDELLKEVIICTTSILKFCSVQMFYCFIRYSFRKLCYVIIMLFFFRLSDNGKPFNLSRNHKTCTVEKSER